VSEAPDATGLDKNPPLAQIIVRIDRVVGKTRLEARATNAGERVRAGRPKASHEPINAARSPGATCAKTSSLGRNTTLRYACLKSV